MTIEIAKLLDEKQGIKLDIGCGASKHPSFVGIDMQALPGVDIVHDLEDTPWPLPDECVLQAISSHVLEHINPAKGKFIDVMNEVWRVCKPGAQFAFVVPYAGNQLYWQDPTHCNGITEATIYYFDPDPEGRYAGNSLYNFYKPKPWKIEFLAADRNGVLECILSKRFDSPNVVDPLPADITQEFRDVRTYLVR